MEKDKKETGGIQKEQAGEAIKSDMPVKNTMTDEIKKSASQTPGLNQAKTTREDLLPSDGDNLTN